MAPLDDGIRIRPPAGGAAYREGVFFLVIVVVAWGLTWPVNKLLLESLSPLWMMALRSAIATVALFAVSIALGRLARPPRADLPVLLSITLLHMVGFTLLSAWGLRLVPAGRSVVLAYTAPLWVILGAVLFLGERLTWRRMTGVAIGMLGLLVLFNPAQFDWTDHDVILGNGAIVLAAVLWAASILHIRGHRWQSNPFDLIPWELLLASVILIPAAVASGAPGAEWNGRLAALLFYASIPGTALAYWAAAVASRNLPAVTTALGLLTTPLVGVAAAVLWLGEPLTLLLVAAIVLILGGIALGTTGGRALV